MLPERQTVVLIEGVLRRATKIVPGLRGLEYSERLECMNSPSMKYSQERGDTIETYKYIHMDCTVSTTISWKGMPSQQQEGKNVS